MIRKNSNSKGLKQKNTAKKYRLNAQKLWFTLTKNLQRKSFTYSFLLHITLLLLLILAANLLVKKNTTINLSPTPSTQATQPIVHAKAISQQEITQQFKAYDKQQQLLNEERIEQQKQRQQQIKAIEQRMAKAQQAEAKRQQAIALEKEKQRLAKEKAQREAAQKKALEEAQKQKEKDNQEQLRKQAQQKTQALKDKQAKEREAQRIKAQQQALKALQQSTISNLNARSQSAQAKTKTEQALQAYAVEYKKRIEAAWIMDDCRDIDADKLPTVFVIPGQKPSISVSSGNRQCDRSLLMAFNNAQAPSLPLDNAAKNLILKGIDFQFGQKDE